MSTRQTPLISVRGRALQVVHCLGINWIHFLQVSGDGQDERNSVFLRFEAKYLPLCSPFYVHHLDVEFAFPLRVNREKFLHIVHWKAVDVGLFRHAILQQELSIPHELHHRSSHQRMAHLHFINHFTAYGEKRTFSYDLYPPSRFLSFGDVLGSIPQLVEFGKTPAIRDSRIPVYDDPNYLMIATNALRATLRVVVAFPSRLLDVMHPNYWLESALLHSDIDVKTLGIAAMGTSAVPSAFLLTQAGFSWDQLYSFNAKFLITFHAIYCGPIYSAAEYLRLDKDVILEYYRLTLPPNEKSIFPETIWRSAAQLLEYREAHGFDHAFYIGYYHDLKKKKKNDIIQSILHRCREWLLPILFAANMRLLAFNHARVSTILSRLAISWEAAQQQVPWDPFTAPEAAIKIYDRQMQWIAPMFKVLGESIDPRVNNRYFVLPMYRDPQTDWVDARILVERFKNNMQFIPTRLEENLRPIQHLGDIPGVHGWLLHQPLRQLREDDDVVWAPGFLVVLPSVLMQMPPIPPTLRDQLEDHRIVTYRQALDEYELASGHPRHQQLAQHAHHLVVLEAHCYNLRTLANLIKIVAYLGPEDVRITLVGCPSLAGPFNGSNTSFRPDQVDVTAKRFSYGATHESALRLLINVPTTELPGLDLPLMEEVMLVRSVLMQTYMANLWHAIPRNKNNLRECMDAANEQLRQYHMIHILSAGHIEESSHLTEIAAPDHSRRLAFGYANQLPIDGSESLGNGLVIVDSATLPFFSREEIYHIVYSIVRRGHTQLLIFLTPSGIMPFEMIEKRLRDPQTPGSYFLSPRDVSPLPGPNDMDCTMS